MAVPSIDQLRGLQASLNSAIDSYVENAKQTQAAGSQRLVGDKTRISAVASRIVDAVKNPIADITALGLQGTQNLALRLAIDLNLLNLINDRVSLDKLVKQTKADRMLLLRILRLLVSMHVFVEPEEHIYTSTALSKVLQLPNLQDWIKTCFDTFQPIWNQTPAFLAKNGYKDINDLSNNPTLAMYGSNFFQQLGQDPRREADFASAMRIQDLAPPIVMPQFPYSDGVQSFMAEHETNRSDIFLVDIGGGHGQYLNRLIGEHPELPGRKVLQDLPSVIARIDPALARFEPMVHDFFTPQPIYGAMYYHLRGILHDWPDDSCVEILTQLRPSFKPRYSRLLVHSYVIPETGSSQREAMLDINMWTCCGMERTESHWHSLLKRAGFHILRIVKAKIGPFGMIEAGLIDDVSS